MVEATNDALNYWPVSSPGPSPQAMVDLTTFVNDPNEPNYTNFADPRIVFDALAGRWLLTVLLYDNSTPMNSEVALAASETSDPSGNWFIYYLPSDPYSSTSPNDLLADQPKVGYSSDAIEVSWNGFSGTTFAGAVLDALPAAPTFAGATYHYAVEQWTSNQAENSLVPAVSMTPSSYAWASYSDAPGAYVGAIYFSGTPSATNSTFGAETDLTTSSFAAPPVAVQPDPNASIATNDNRLLSAVWDAGVLWLAGNDGCSPSSSLEACLRVISIATPQDPSSANPTLGQDYDISASGADLYFPALALDASGDLTLSYTESSSSLDPSSELSFIPADELSSSTPPSAITSVTVFAGSSSYFPSCGTACEQGGGYRWGDYSGAATNPQTPSQVWVVSELAQAPPTSPNTCLLSSGGSTSDTGCWSTAIGEYTAALPYTPLAPSRICDTRPTAVTRAPIDQCTGHTLGTGGKLTVQVAGLGGVPTTGAAAVALNVTGISPSEGTYLTVYPFGATTPLASNLNLTAGEVVPNLVVATLGPGGAITIFNQQGATNVAVDVEGYYGLPTPADAGAYFNPLPPARICDTRPTSETGSASDQCTGKTLGAGATLPVGVFGQGGVPTTATAVVVNVTVTNTTAPSYLTVWPAGGQQPVASNLNWLAGETVPNRVVVPLSTSGGIDVFNFAGDTDVIIDVNGYYSASTAGTYIPLSPDRICDTRPTSQTGAASDQCTGASLGPGGTLSVQVSGLGGVPSGATALIANVTVTDTGSSSYLTVWPDGLTRPTASDLNWRAGATTANLVVVELSSAGKIDVYNLAGTADVIIDVEGYFG